MFSDCSFLCYQTREQDILRNPNFDANWPKWSMGHGHEMIDFRRQEVKGQSYTRSKVKVTRGQR